MTNRGLKAWMRTHGACADAVQCGHRAGGVDYSRGGGVMTVLVAFLCGLIAAVPSFAVSFVWTQQFPSALALSVKAFYAAFAVMLIVSRVMRERAL